MIPASGDVVVTGLGVVAGRACGIGSFTEALKSAVMPRSVMNRTDGYHLPDSAQTAVLASRADLGGWLAAADSRRMSLPSQLAVVAARMAVEDARATELIAGARTAIFVSSAFGAVSVTENILRTLMHEGPEMVSPTAFTESVANVAAAQIAISNQILGSTFTISQREAGPLTAVGRAAREIAAGRLDRALVGAVEEMPPILHALLDRLGSLARPTGCGGEVARPFDRHRHGFVAAEGATVLVLEAASLARARGATVRARVRGFGGAFDLTAPRLGWGRGHVPLAAALHRLSARSGVQLSDVGRIVSGASGSIAGDRLEAHTLREAWAGHRLPPILVPKSVIGEYGGGFLAAAILSVSAEEAAPTQGFVEPDADLCIRPHEGGKLGSNCLTLVTGLASGGPAAWLLLDAG